jgi:hypothetical protein
MENTEGGAGTHLSRLTVDKQIQRRAEVQMMQFLGKCSRNWLGVFSIIFVVAVFSSAAMAQPVDPFPPEVWYNVYDSTYGHDAGYGVAIDSQKNVIVAGNRRTSVPAEYANSYAVKYNYSGNFVCEMAVSGPTDGAGDSFHGVAVDNQDNIIVAGTISGNSSTNFYYNAMYLNKYDSVCNSVWSNPVVYVEGTPGNSYWQEAHSVTVDENDNIYPTGRVFVGWGNNQSDWATWKYNSNGVPQAGFPIYYNYSFNWYIGDYSYDVAVDNLGNIITVGVRGVSGQEGSLTNNLDWHVRKYNPSGTLLWEDTFGGTANLADYAYRVAIDSQNNPIVAGYTNIGTNNTTGADYDWLVIKYSADGVSGAGQRLWTYTYESEDGMSEAAQAVAVDENDNVIVGGQLKVDTTTIHGRLALLDGATGNLLGERIISTPANVIPLRLAYQYATLAIGGYISDPAGTNNNMYSALLAWDITPGTFSFTDQVDVALSAVIESNVITVTGIEYASPISITGGEYAIDGGPYTSVAGFVNNLQTVQVRQTSSSSDSTTTNATLTIGGVSDTFSVKTIAAIGPISPADGEIFTACSYLAPPLFQWTLNEAFQKLEIRIFTPANPAKPAKVKVKDPTATQFQMTQSTWKKILKLPGLSGGALSWKIVGTNKGFPAVESEVFTMTIAAPEPAGKPDISPVSQTSLPTMTWGNSCGTKFKAYFSADSAFSKSKKLSFKYQGSTNPDDVFSAPLDDKTWGAIRKLVGDVAGSNIYYYVESWDIVKRYQKTPDAYLTLEP